MEQECRTCGGDRWPFIRGCCQPCYNKWCRSVRAGLMSWDRLEASGRVLAGKNGANPGGRPRKVRAEAVSDA